MKRGEIKRLLRQATRWRIRAERQASLASLPYVIRKAHIEDGRVDQIGRLEESAALNLFAGVPSVFAVAEKLNPKYHRPAWADHRYGAK